MLSSPFTHQRPAALPLPIQLYQERTVHGAARKDDDEGHDMRKCSTCGKLGVKGRQHWKAAADRAEGEARSVCGYYMCMYVHTK